MISEYSDKSKKADLRTSLKYLKEYERVKAKEKLAIKKLKTLKIEPEVYNRKLFKVKAETKAMVDVLREVYLNRLNNKKNALSLKKLMKFKELDSHPFVSTVDDLKPKKSWTVDEKLNTVLGDGSIRRETTLYESEAFVHDIDTLITLTAENLLTVLSMPHLAVTLYYLTITFGFIDKEGASRELSRSLHTKPVKPNTAPTAIIDSTVRELVTFIERLEVVYEVSILNHLKITMFFFSEPRHDYFPKTD